MSATTRIGLGAFLFPTLLLGGCASLSLAPTKTDSFPTTPLEIAYQVTNAVDFAQTVNTARRPDCYRESDLVTSQIIGSHPSTQSVEAMWAIQSAAHYLVSNWLDREAEATGSRSWEVARIIWHGAMLGNSIRNVVANERIGLRPFGSGSNCDSVVHR